MPKNTKMEEVILDFGKISKDQMPNDQNSGNDQKSVRWTVGAATYFFKNTIEIEMI